MNKVVKITCGTMLAVTLLSSSLTYVPTAEAAGTVTKAPVASLQPFGGTKLKTFMISSKSYVQIKDVYFLYNNNEKTTHYTITVYNGDNTEIDFNDYWVEMHSVNGGKYNVTPNPANKKSSKVAPKTSEEFSFYSKVDQKVNYTDLKFRLVKWDFNAPNYTRTLGETRITSAYKNSVPTNNYYILRKNNEKIKTNFESGTRFTVGDQSQIQVRFKMENIGFTRKDLSSYQFSLKTKQGYIIKLESDLQADQKLDPSQSVSILLTGSLKSNVDVNGAQLLLSSISDGETKFESPVSIYNVVWYASSNFVAPTNTAKKYTVNGQNIQAIISSVYRESNDASDTISINMKWLNNGKKAVKLPKYEYVLLSSNGAQYPITVKDEEIQLLPGVEKEMELKVKIPTAATAGMTLLINQPKEENKTNGYIAAAFKVPPVTTTTPVSKKTYRNATGAYEFEIKKVERLPWGQEDLLNIYVTVSNDHATKSLVIPDIKSKLNLNGVNIDEKAITMIKADDQILLPAKSSTSFIVSTKVPYNYKFNEVQLTLLDQISEETKETIGLFTAKNVTEVPKRNLQDPFKIQTMGRKATLQFENATVFEGKSSDLYYAEFSYTNDEMRFTTLPVLKAFFKTNDNQYIDADLPNIKTKISPTGKALLVVSGRVPKSFSKEGAKLIIGEGITEGKFSTTEGTPDRMINGISFDLPKLENTVSKELKDLIINPYKFTVNSIDSGLEGLNTLKLDMNYTLENLNAYEVNETKRKLTFVVNDGVNEYEQSLELDAAEGGLKPGIKKKVSVSFTGNEIGSVLFRGYKLSVYEEYNSHRKLLGTKEFSWYSIEKETPQTPETP
ncbi:hypothetical protein [Paenibacillus spongiae]|uniref:DUF916 domain-containing protein n=1 Tax=Paenibacillus spongiae TaxID=2909671 RepID=A0ABY5S8K1_9BACL|nr:hypothetical protein [Paenibacillus spongiae]UVI29915.1 hypothetical protein L1F29_31785 [Paenibacillus spongiae]